MQNKGMITLDEEQLHQLHEVELELLVEFDRICRKYDILYSIDGGTLLGAVRHGGFIPWDDDADVIMNRKAYQKFKRVVKRELDTEKFYFQDMFVTEGYRWGYGKLRKKNTEFVRLDQEYMPYKQGVFLDVFVCDYVPENYGHRCLVNFVCYIFRKFFYSEVGRHKGKRISRGIYSLMSMVPEKSLKKLYLCYIVHRNKRESRYVKCLTFPACNSFYGYKREWYEDTEDIEFEGRNLKACKKRKEYLSFLYGDYMSIPPKEKRKTHPVSKFRV